MGLGLGVGLGSGLGGGEGAERDHNEDRLEGVAHLRLHAGTDKVTGLHW